MNEFLSITLFKKIQELTCSKGMRKTGVNSLIWTTIVSPIYMNTSAHISASKKRKFPNLCRSIQTVSYYRLIPREGPGSDVGLSPRLTAVRGCEERRGEKV